MNIKKAFIKFLHIHNIRTDFENGLARRYAPISFDVYLDKHMDQYERYIFKAFGWAASSQGWDFWSEFNDLWYDICIKKDPKYFLIEVNKNINIL